MNGLKERSINAWWVQVGRGRVANTTGHGSREVGEDVTKEVVGHQDAVALGVFHEVDAGGIHVLVVNLHRGVLARHFGHDTSPQVAGKRQDVGLVDQRDLGAGQGDGALEGIANTTLHTKASIDRTLRSDFLRCAIAQDATFTGVGAFGVFTDNRELASFGQRTGRGAKGSVVDVEIKAESDAQQKSPLQQPSGNPRVANGGANRSQQDGVVTSECAQGVLIQNKTIAQVAGGTEIKLCRLKGYAGRRHHFEGRRGDFGSDPVTTNDGNAMCCVLRHVAYLVFRVPLVSPTRWSRGKPALSGNPPFR